MSMMDLFYIGLDKEEEALVIIPSSTDVYDLDFSLLQDLYNPDGRVEAEVYTEMELIEAAMTEIATKICNIMGLHRFRVTHIDGSDIEFVRDMTNGVFKVLAE